MTLTIQITQADIDAGIDSALDDDRSTTCPLARAIQRRRKGADVYVDSVNTIFVNGMHYVAVEGGEFIEAFDHAVDEGGPMPNPRTVVLEEWTP